VSNSPYFEKVRLGPLSLTCFFSGESQDAHESVYGDGGDEKKAKFSHELIAGAAAFEGFKLFEDQQRKEGMSDSRF
jgi:Protein of unknown function (DUF3759)